MNCEQANQISLVDYLYLLGYQPLKVRNQDYWYLSPVREEKEASFKVNRKKNVWYDHGLGKGGNVIEFAVQFLIVMSVKHYKKFLLFTSKKISFPFRKQRFQSIKIFSLIQLMKVLRQALK